MQSWTTDLAAVPGRCSSISNGTGGSQWGVHLHQSTPGNVVAFSKWLRPSVAHYELVEHLAAHHSRIGPRAEVYHAKVDVMVQHVAGDRARTVGSYESEALLLDVPRQDFPPLWSCHSVLVPLDLQS